MNVNIGGFRTLGDPDRNKVANLFIEKIFNSWLCPDSSVYPSVADPYPDPDWIRIQQGQWYSESGSRRAKMSHKSRNFF
jgi:hypothetical protein